MTHVPTPSYSGETREAVARVLADHFCDETYYVSWERLPDRNQDYYRAMADEVLAAVAATDRRPA